MIQVVRAIYEEDMYLLTPAEYDRLPDGVVLMDIRDNELYTKGSPANYKEMERAYLFNKDILPYGWTAEMAKSQGFGKDFMMMMLAS